MPVLARIVQLALPVALIIYCNKNAIYIADDLKVLQETKYIIMCILSLVIAFAIILVIFALFTILDLSQYTNILYSFLGIVGTILACLGVYFICHWVENELKKIEFVKARQEKVSKIVSDELNKTNHKLMTLEDQVKQTSALSDSSMAIVSFRSLSEVLSAKDIHINAVLLDSQCYHYLMQHLSHEFSIECLLSYTEFTFFMVKIDIIFELKAQNDPKLNKFYSLLLLPKRKQRKNKKNKNKNRNKNKNKNKNNGKRPQSPLSKAKLSLSNRLSNNSKGENSVSKDNNDTDGNDNGDCDGVSAIGSESVTMTKFSFEDTKEPSTSLIVPENFDIDRGFEYDRTTIPQSFIVDIEHTNKKLKNLADNQEKIVIFRSIAYELYSKYIASDAEYEINVSSRLRSDFTKKMHNKELYIRTGTSNENDASVSDSENAIMRDVGGIMLVSDDPDIDSGPSSDIDNLNGMARAISVEEMKRIEERRIKEMKRLFTLFGRCNKEMLKLMSYSLSRMKSKEDMWNKVQHCLLSD